MSGVTWLARQSRFASVWGYRVSGVTWLVGQSRVVSIRGYHLSGVMCRAGLSRISTSPSGNIAALDVAWLAEQSHMLHLEI